jgi:hypothetical protein
MNALNRILVALLLGTTLVAPARADQNDEAQKEVKGFWNVDSMMLQAADNIARRYNLNDNQREQTRKLMVDEVTGFLNDHPDVWPLVRDLARYQMQGKPPEGEIAKQIGGRALPLLEDIRNSILTANERWRNILTEEQKAMHDYDLQDMQKTFAKMESNFRQMREGVPINPGVLPGPNDGTPPHTPPVPPVQQTSGKIIPPNTKDENTEDYWESYVKKFIEVYELDEAQSVAARSIMNECKQRAQAYRQSKQKEFADVEQRLIEARRDGQTPQAQQAKIRVWTQVQKGLNKPIYDLFQELKDRLEPIPTDAQREKAAAKGVRIDRTRVAAHPTSAEPPKDGAATAIAPAPTSASPEKPAGEGVHTPAASNAPAAAGPASPTPQTPAPSAAPAPPSATEAPKETAPPS